MVSAQSSNLGKTYSLLMIKSFLIWTFTLAVCLLVVGFPLVYISSMLVGCGFSTSCIDGYGRMSVVDYLTICDAC